MVKLKGKGLGIATAHRFEDEPSSMIHEQLARLKFAESHIRLEGKRVLDFGCGTGYNCYYIAQRNAPREVVGVDLLEECIDYCRTHYSGSKSKYLVQDCLKYNPGLGVFDAIISCEVIEHVDDQITFLYNLKKYLAPGGFAFLSTPNRAMFSLGKEVSFQNHTHKRELFFHEFRDLLKENFSEIALYSQMHSSHWHSAYINYLSAANLSYVMRNSWVENKFLRKAASLVSLAPYVPVFLSRKHPDVRKRKFSDFEFSEGFDEKAIWFVAVCKA